MVGHIASTVRKESVMNAYGQLIFSFFYSCRTLVEGVVPSAFSVTSIKII